VARSRSDVLDVELRANIRSRGLRATGARIAVLRMLAVEARPMSHGELFAKLPGDFDRTTIFRALGVLTAARLIMRVELGDRVWRYTRAIRAPDDGSLAATFVCTACGEVEELADVAISTPTGPRSLRRGAVEVFVHGRCDACASPS
jgi:Fe2+ or Zn2+ uptake regulation protein